MNSSQHENQTKRSRERRLSSQRFRKENSLGLCERATGFCGFNEDRRICPIKTSYKDPSNGKPEQKSRSNVEKEPTRKTSLNAVRPSFRRPLMLLRRRYSSAYSLLTFFSTLLNLAAHIQFPAESIIDLILLNESTFSVLFVYTLSIIASSL